MARTVLVTGVTGFLGGHVASDLLAHGYDVRGTVRDPRTAAVAHLRAAAQRSGGRFDLAAADLLDDAGWDAAVAGVDLVAHVASPTPDGRVTDPESAYVRPAVEGTRRVLHAAARAGVARVALTSSIDAARAGHELADGRDRTEDDWAILHRADGYARSKALAERAAWGLAAEHGFELVTLLPGLILGPSYTVDTSVSVAVIRQILARELPGLPRMGIAPVDVRDVAAGHRLALETPAAAGRRYILAGEPIWLPEVARALRDALAPRGYRVPTRTLPSWLVRLAARVNPTLRVSLPYLDAPARTPATRARAELGWTARPWRETVADSAESFIALGAVPRP
jgi:nucleoside-diphosphate-sugar epimerase